MIKRETLHGKTRNKAMQNTSANEKTYIRRCGQTDNQNSKRIFVATLYIKQNSVLCC